MLNSKGAQNVDIFKVNQLVHSRTSIFVGRDPHIGKMVSSGDNYVLYGGRRIGKSSVLQELRRRLERAGVLVAYHSFEGDENCVDRQAARKIAQKIGLQADSVDEFKATFQNKLNEDRALKIAILIDEIDAYIHDNPRRHVLVQTLRALSDEYDDRFRVIAAGFMDLYKCLQGRGPFTPASDPWIRMFNNEHGPLPNLESTQAERIVIEGFREILGWRFETGRIPQLIIERTGGHPAFVQYFCMKLQRLVGQRNDQIIMIQDIEEIFGLGHRFGQRANILLSMPTTRRGEWAISVPISLWYGAVGRNDDHALIRESVNCGRNDDQGQIFNDQQPQESFIAHVRDTLEMNIKDPFGRFLLLFLASGNSNATRRFSYQQAQEIADILGPIVPTERLKKNLERLTVTSVLRERSKDIFEFTVPDYPRILERLGENSHLDELEDLVRTTSQPDT